MIWMRAIIYGFPALIVAVFFTAYLSVSRLGSSTANQLVVADIGEAKMLNPLLSTAAIDGSIEDCIFDSLISLDADANLVGGLAESWSFTQISTVFANNDEMAQKALAVVEGHREQWAEWTLEEASADRGALRLRFASPGSRLSRVVYDLLDPETLQPLSVLKVALKSSARESAVHFLGQAICAPQIKRLWVESSVSYELTVAGDVTVVIAELASYYEANPDLEARFLVVDESTHLDEPQLKFTLRHSVRWHDGAPFTAEDVVFTYRMLMDESVVSPRSADFLPISEVVADGPHEVMVSYRRPYSSALNSWMIPIIPKHILDGKSTNWWAENFNRAPIGTGPFKFTEWRANKHIILAKNSDYFLGAPHLDTIAFRPVPDPVSLRLNFETGQSDYWLIPEHAVEQFAASPEYECVSSPVPSYSYIGWNLRRPLFQDVRVRRALAHAVDVDAIIKYVLYGHGERSTGIFPPQMWFFNPDVRPIPYDPEKARALLAEAGWSLGADGVMVRGDERFSFTLITNQGKPQRKDVAELVQANLKDIGVEVRLELYEWAVFIEQCVHAHDFDAMVLGWSLPFDFDQYQVFHSSQTGQRMLNSVGYMSPVADQLMEELRTTFDHDEVISLAGQLQQTIYDDQPYMFLYVPHETYAFRKDSLRVRRPVEGKWIDEPVRSIPVGFKNFQEWFYRTSHAPVLTP